MSKKSKSRKTPPSPRPEARPEPRLYLVTPPLVDAREFAPKLEAALAAADVACVLLTIAPGADGGGVIATLAPIAGRHDTALLLSATPGLARAAGVDGVNVRGAGDGLGDALSTFKPDLIVGASGLRSRHDAMTAGEEDIDYLMFGDPAPDGWTPPMADTLERVAWWAEIFNIPCVGFASSLEDIAPLVAAGADFVAVGDAVWNDSRGPGEAALAATRLLRAPMEAA